MIKARKNRIFELLFERYNRWLIRRRFHSVHIEGQEILESLSPLPKIFCLNHSSWWDGLIAYFLSRLFRFDGYCMMEEKQLSKLRPFTWIGAFSVVRENPREAAISIKYAVKILTAAPNRALWIFPQGRILPNDVRPIEVSGGAVKIAEKCLPCEIIPVALRYEFLGSYKPSIFVSVGPAISVSHSKQCASLAHEVSDELGRLLDRLRTRIKNGDTKGLWEIL